MANNSLLYGIIGALGLTVAGGGGYIATHQGSTGETKTAAVTAPAAPAPVATPAPPPPAPAPPPPPKPKPAVTTTPPPPPPPPSTAQAEGVFVKQLVGDARRAITRGDFAAAGRALDQAERMEPRSADVIAARRDLREAQQHASHDNKRIESLVADARGAITRHDYTMAGRLLDQAGQIDPRDHLLQQARAELDKARQQASRDTNRRVDDLVAQARTAIAHHDYVAADRFLDQAESIDRHDRDVQQARAELNAAQRPPNGPVRR